MNYKTLIKREKSIAEKLKIIAEKLKMQHILFIKNGPKRLIL